jgi:hypothetical protein
MSKLGTIHCWIELEPLDTTEALAKPILDKWKALKHEQPLWVVDRAYVMRELEDGNIHRTCTLYPDLSEMSEFINLVIEHSLRIKAIMVEDEIMTMAEYTDKYGFTAPEPRPIIRKTNEKIPDTLPGFQTAAELAAADGFLMQDNSKLKRRKRKP